MDNLSLYPPGVGPQDDFDFPNSGKSKLFKDPRLAKQFANIANDLEKPKHSSESTGGATSPTRPRRSEDRFEKSSRDRSLDRSPKRGRDHFREERYKREDSYDRRSSHRGRRTPSPPSPQAKRSRSSRDSQQYDRRTYRDPTENQFSYPTGYQNQSYTQPPPNYGNQPPQFPAYMPPAAGADPFMPPTSYMTTNYMTSSGAPPGHQLPGMMGGLMNAAPPQQQAAGTAEGQWIALQQPQQTSQSQSSGNSADNIKREAAIASEKRQQKVTLLKQRDEYLRKVNNLKRELQVLKDQRNELKGSTRTPPSPDSYRFLKENSKLQVEISNKLKTMNNVIDMLSGIIGEDGAVSDRDKRKSVEKSGARTPGSSPERAHKKEDRGFSSERNSKQSYNYIHYDPEMHWCQVCDVFPKTAKEYLNHLHDPEHILNMETGPGLEAPWHQILTEEDEEPPAIAGAATKRLPIRGLQHFAATSAWFCKLCNKWIGDLHCASAHLKSKGHAKSYTRFTEQNPHWETDWMADRQKAYERSCSGNPEKFTKDQQPMFPQASSNVMAPDTSDVKVKKKHSKKEKKNKKKSKKHKKSKSSSSDTSSDSGSDSSDKLSDKASSIRVAMRNKLKQHAAEMLLNEKVANAGKWLVEKTSEKSFKQEQESPQKPERDDKMLMQWMANKGVITESDKKMFETLRMRLKNRQEIESAKEIEYQKVKPQPSVIPLIREQAEAAAIKQREAEEEAQRQKEKLEAEKENERREKERDRDRDRGDRDGHRDRDYYKDRESRSYYRDRKRSPGNHRNRYYDYIARSPDRERDRERRHYRSRSPEHRSRVEVGVITNPPPAPKPPKYEKKKYKNDDSSDEKEKSKFKRYSQQQQQQHQSNKKLPFIGRMPVFKVKQKDDSPKNTDDEDKRTGLERAIQKRDEINAQIQKAMQEASMKNGMMVAPPPPSISDDSKQTNYDMAPPPPNITYEDPPAGFVTQQELPPGIESPSALEEIKIPPSVAHPGKPLPKDFADALDIIFPDETKKPDTPAVAPVEPPQMDVMQMMVPPYGMEVPQYSDYTFALPAVSYEAPIAVPPPMDIEEEAELPPAEPVEEKKDRPELDDLAMLGIDESDITAQCF